MKTDNIIEQLSRQFSVRIIRLYEYLKKNKIDLVLCRQLLRSGTSVGANVAESIHAQSTADFVSKLNIALKEADETKFWLDSFYAVNYLNEEQYNSITNDCCKIIATLVKIINTTKDNNKD